MPKYQLRTVVIDPGHGGHDTGCLGSSSQEKHIALDVSLKLGALIERHFPDIRVIYTRKTDVFIELHERAAIANRNHADLFICIHCNSGPAAAFGAETFVMGLHKTSDNLSVAKRENASILLEKDYKTNYDGFDPNSPEANIIFSLYQNTFMQQSLAFASLLQDAFEQHSGRFNRGVKQAGFLVLFRTAMPSVLIELGFLTNKADERFLTSEKGQESMANSILKAFTIYKSETERKAGGGQEVERDPAPSGKDPAKPVHKDEKPSSSSPDHTKSTTNQVVVDSVSALSKDSIIIRAKPEVFYTIQVGAIANADATDESRFSSVSDISKIIGGDGITRFYSGVYYDIDETRKALSEIKGKGFSDAFICAFSGPRRISITEAGQLLKRQ
jgi:N-acetylmuramoyl-L-alanine amidase